MVRAGAGSRRTHRRLENRHRNIGSSAGLGNLRPGVKGLRVDDDHMSLPVVLLDLDDVLFPWAFAYREFRARHNLSPIPPQAWRDYAIGEATIAGHQALMARFHNDDATTCIGPVPGRAQDCLELSKTFSLVACTSRYEATEGPGTLAWTQRWAPWLSGVRFCNWHPESGKQAVKDL